MKFKLSFGLLLSTFLNYQEAIVLDIHNNFVLYPLVPLLAALEKKHYL
jgi:hypothetical protein